MSTEPDRVVEIKVRDDYGKAFGVVHMLSIRCGQRCLVFFGSEQVYGVDFTVLLDEG